MKILSNSTYDDLLDQIKQGDDSIRDYVQKEKDLKRYYVQKQKDLEGQLENEVLKNGQVLKENDKLLQNNIVLLKQCDSLKLQVEHLQNSLLTMEKKLRIAHSRIGGFTKQNHKLLSELGKTKCILQSYKGAHDMKHPKKTINQYDKRLKGINKKK